MNKQTFSLYSQVWMKAAKDGEVYLPFGDKRECYRARFALYTVKTKVKSDYSVPQELREAIERCTIYLDKSNWSLTVSSKLHGELSMKVAAALGLSVEDELPEIEQANMTQEVAESAKKLMEKLNEPAQPRTTPYYTRGDE